MPGMKKHPLLRVDILTTVTWTSLDHRQFNKWLKLSSRVFAKLLQQGILPKAKFKDVEVFHLSLLVCGGARIRKLNKEFRNKDKVTDVLSFPSQEGLRKIKSSYEKEIFLGDLAICQSQAFKQAQSYSISYWDEFMHLMFHGIIHLLGYDHEVSVKEERIMLEWEEEAMRLLSEAKKKGL